MFSESKSSQKLLPKMSDQYNIIGNVNMPPFSKMAEILKVKIVTFPVLIIHRGGFFAKINFLSVQEFNKTIPQTSKNLPGF